MYVQAGHTVTGEKDAPVTNLVEQTMPNGNQDQAQQSSHCSLILLACILPPALAWCGYYDLGRLHVKSYQNPNDGIISL